MPTFNQEQLVGASIESVLSQTFDDWELVIGDDCSSDNTLLVAELYERRDPNRVKVIRNDRNLGITGNCNEILRRCSGKYVAFAAGDDLFLPHKLECQVAVMERYPDSIICYHDVEVFDSDTGVSLRHWNRGAPSNKPVAGNAQAVAEALVEHGTGFMAAVSVMARRSSLPATGFDSRVPVASDWLMWIETCAKNAGTVRFVEEVHSRYRKHAGGTTTTPDQYREDELVTLSIVEARYPRLMVAAKRRRALLMAGVAGDFMKAGEYGEARRLLWESLAFSPREHTLYLRWLGSWLKQMGLRRA